MDPEQVRFSSIYQLNPYLIRYTFDLATKEPLPGDSIEVLWSGAQPEDPAEHRKL